MNTMCLKTEDKNRKVQDLETRSFDSILQRNMNIFIMTNIRNISSTILPSPLSLSDTTSIPNRSIQIHSLFRKHITLFPLILSQQLPINPPLNQPITPLDPILMKPIRRIKTKLVNLFINITVRVIVGLNDGAIFAEKLKINLILQFITFERGKVEVEVEAICVTFWSLNFGGEGSV
ncbi:hypothetical protein MtrunA17_Chr8g0350721 [Medicago truncatula]|uniref:Uncharacterized protein n=1 Tax=Medicago truncatula TaxID=3880 RepID=A0A396GFH4_MEDTR|nr:hypothetical protein MtrunA17_Chr8g0350721 [Medicago truncatula]